MGFLKRLFGDQAAPATTADSDRMTIEQLRRAGADLALSRETLHYLYLPTEAGARQAEARVAGRGRTIEVRPAATGSSWLVLTKQPMVVSEASIGAVRGELEGVAAALGGEYDGWEAAVTPG